jgi:peptidoglycan hydrolase-like protein with peptidoglycan-binding domain
VLATLLIAGTAGLIARNALTMQTSRHPAPLFGTARPEPVAARPARPAAASAAQPTASPVPPARPEAVPPAPPPTAKPATRDRIGDLIRAESTGSTSAAPQANKAEPQRSVALAQKALTKLGYGPLKADGVMGGGTKQAIERFERDRHITETGELGPKTSRELAARAGFALE